MSTSESSSERLVLFTDAVSAIAITLLILPLVDVVPEATAHHEDLGELLRDHLAQLGAFVLSFAVIYRLWWAHHQIFRHVSVVSRRLVQWSILWTFAIVFLPLPTAIITAYRASPATVGLYGGTLLLASGSLVLLSQTVHRHPELSGGTSVETREEALGSISSFGAQLLAVIVGCVFADTVNYWAFLLMFLTGPIERIIRSRWRNEEWRPD